MRGYSIEAAAVAGAARLRDMKGTVALLLMLVLLLPSTLTLLLHSEQQEGRGEGKRTAQLQAPLSPPLSQAGGGPPTAPPSHPHRCLSLSHCAAESTAAIGDDAAGAGRKCCVYEVVRQNGQALVGGGGRCLSGHLGQGEQGEERRGAELAGRSTTAAAHTTTTPASLLLKPGPQSTFLLPTRGCPPIRHCLTLQPQPG